MHGEPCTRPATFDTFKRLLPVWNVRNQDMLEYAQAKLSISHPLRPDPFEALQTLRKHANSDWEKWLATCVKPTYMATGAKAWIFFIKTAQLLAETGRLDDAKWVLDRAKEALPLRFQMKAAKGGSTDNGKRLPTPDEAADGLVDPDGYYRSMIRRSEIYTDGAST